MHVNSLECPIVETTSDHDPDDFRHLYDDELAFADDCEETWEEWEEDESLDRTRHEEGQDSGHADGDQQEWFLLYPGQGLHLV